MRTNYIIASVFLVCIAAAVKSAARDITTPACDEFVPSVFPGKDGSSFADYFPNIKILLRDQVEMPGASVVSGGVILQSKPGAAASWEVSGVPSTSVGPAETGTVTSAGAKIPLSFYDPLFEGVVNSGAVILLDGRTLSNKSITENGPSASVALKGAATLDNVRISSNEGVRIGGSGDVNISNSWIEATGQPGDHADAIQAYAPGSSGVVTITNTAIVNHPNNAAAGMFVADGYTGTFTFNNVMFYGGPWGLRINADGTADDYVSLTNVYFVGPFSYGPFLFQEVTANIHITHWENVRYATIVNGVLVPGSLIRHP